MLAATRLPTLPRLLTGVTQLSLSPTQKIIAATNKGGNTDSDNPNSPNYRYRDTGYVAQEVLVSGDEFGDISGKQLRAAVSVYARKHFVGRTYRNQSDGQAISVTWQGIKHAIAGAPDDELRVLSVLPELLVVARLVETRPDKLNRPQIKAVHFYDAMARLSGAPVGVRIVVREMQDGHRFYDHFLAAKENPAGTSGDALRKGALVIQPTAGSGISMGRKMFFIKPRSPRRLFFTKAYIHGHYRVNKKTGKRTWINSYDDKRETRQGKTEFAHWSHRKEHFKQHLAHGRQGQALHAFHDLDHDKSHQLAAELGLHTGEKHENKKALMEAVHGKVREAHKRLQQKVADQVKTDFEKRKTEGKVGSQRATKTEKPEAKGRQSSIAAVIDIATQPKRDGNQAYHVYRSVTPDEAEQAKKAEGPDLSGNEATESARGQVAVTREDLLKLPEITDPAKADFVDYHHKTAEGLPAVLYKKRFNGTTVVVEEVRARRGRLALKTLWKTRHAPRATPEGGFAHTSETVDQHPQQGKQSIDPPKPESKPAPRTLDAKPGALEPDELTLDLNGKDLGFKYRLVEADDLAPTTDKADNQYRDRNRAASSEQVAAIAGNLKFRLLADAPVMDHGSPVLAEDGKTIIGGNGRTLAIHRAYNNGKADQYKADLLSRAAKFGFDADAAKGMKNPVLVRVLNDKVDIKQAAIASNEGGGARMSALEQARVDGDRLGDLSDFAADDAGNVATAANQPFIRRFLAQVPAAQRSAFMASDGRLSKEGTDRIRNAVLYRAYGDNDVLARMVESADPGQRNVLAAMTRLAPRVAEVNDGIRAERYHDRAIAGDIVAAASALGKIRSDKAFASVDDYLNQGDMFGDPLSEETKTILKHFDENLRSAKAIGDFIKDYHEAVIRLGDPRQEDIFGDAKPTTRELLNDAKKRQAPAETGDLFKSRARIRGATGSDSGKPSADQGGLAGGGEKRSKTRQGAPLILFRVA
jgi:hypothetical protein